MFRVVFFLLFPLNILLALPYTASVQGVGSQTLRREIIKSSILLSAQEKQVPSLNIFRLRAKNDIERIKDVAFYHGYFDCKVESRMLQNDQLNVTFIVTLGEQYTFGKLMLIWSDEEMVLEQVQKRANLLPIGPQIADAPSFQPNAPALGNKIQAIEREVVTALQSRSFAFTKIIAKKLTADRATKTLDIAFQIQTGPMIVFGPTTIVGKTKVEPEFFQARQAWSEGQLYSPHLIEQTESSLLKSGLFRSVQVEEGTTLSDDWALPMKIQASDSKHRSISFGLSYMTTYGAGISASWENRNVQGLGRKLSAQAAIWQRQRSATLSYTIPHFRSYKQDLLYILEYDAQNYLPFTSSAIKASILLNRRLARWANILLGPSVERLESKKILSHQLYHLFKFPVHLRLSSADSPVDPTSGLTLNLRLTPSWQYLEPRFSYLMHSSSLSGYQSFADNLVTLALRLGMANVFDAKKQTIPLPDRVFGGSENALRGYRRGSISPLNKEGEPVGGRSMLTASFEIRLRPQKHLGWVAFYDIGNVYNEQMPRPTDRSLLQSLGLGVRYATPIGPIRFDIAFPLQRRRNIDSIFQIYFSIGQAF